MNRERSMTERDRGRDRVMRGECMEKWTRRVMGGGRRKMREDDASGRGRKDA